MLEFSRGPYRQHMGPPLVQVNRCGWTVSIHQDERFNLLLVKDLILDNKGRRRGSISRVKDELTGPNSFVRLGGTSRGEQRSVAGKLPARAIRAEGRCDGGLPVLVSVEEDLFCAIMPFNKTVVLRFWDDDDSVQEYRVSKGVKPFELSQPWWVRLIFWMTKWTWRSRPVVRGNCTIVNYSDKNKVMRMVNGLVRLLGYRGGHRNDGA